jgi:predicted GH43/DUF377 family glycosyl hydrolase
MKSKLVLMMLLLVSSFGFAEQTHDVPFGAWKRPFSARHNLGIRWNVQPCRCLSQSKIRHALPCPGRPEPVLSPETDYEKDVGVEDPRLQRFGDTYYLTYTGCNKKDAQLCLATSRDLIHWERKGVILPAYEGNWNQGWTKSGAIVPEKIDGKYWMYWLGTAADKTGQMGLSYSTDLIRWTEATAAPVLPGRPGMFDSRAVEPGPPANPHTARHRARLQRRRR